MGLTMAESYAQLEGLWIQAGGSAAAAPIAAAIALAESGGNPSSHNGNAGTGDDSWGLWQINMIGSMGPSRRAQFGLTSNTQLTDPLTNAKAAVALSNNGKNWSPWTTYTSGAYRKYMQGGVTPNLTAAGAGGSATAAPAVDAATITSSIQNQVYNMGNYLFMGMAVIGGLGLLVLGAFLVVKGDSGGILRVIPGVASKV
jgi:hypothetical protein